MHQLHKRFHLTRSVSTCCVLGVVVLLILARRAGAQVAASDSVVTSTAGRAASTLARSDTARTAPWRVGVFVGFARNSPADEILGTTPGRDHFFLGLQAQTEVLRLGDVRISYAAQLLPLVLIRGRTAPLGYGIVVSDTGAALVTRTVPQRLVQGPNTAYAFGVSPFGFEIALPLGHAVSAYGAAAAGGLIFTRPFPVPEATRINFTLEFGGGLLFRAGRERWVQLGYKYHHLSNAYIGSQNPGLDANVFYAGYQWSVRLPR